MAAALKESLDLDAQLIKGFRGVFDVKIDGELIFSKGQMGRFPDNDEVLQLIKDRQP